MVIIPFSAFLLHFPFAHPSLPIPAPPGFPLPQLPFPRQATNRSPRPAFLRTSRPVWQSVLIHTIASAADRTSSHKLAFTRTPASRPPQAQRAGHPSRARRVQTELREPPSSTRSLASRGSWSSRPPTVNVARELWRTRVSPLSPLPLPSQGVTIRASRPIRRRARRRCVRGLHPHHR
ncbi:hypothetical protein BD413DRAFT_157887 [Trametes elegans]|nr:hypothetical protein BD413DRAFT_157887 [Trametes elegans]